LAFWWLATGQGKEVCLLFTVELATEILKKAAAFFAKEDGTR